MVAWNAGASTVLTGLSTERSCPSGTALRPKDVAALGESTMTLTRVSGDAGKICVPITRASGSSLSEKPAAFASAIACISRLRSFTWPAPSMYFLSGMRMPPEFSVATARTISFSFR